MLIGCCLFYLVGKYAAGATPIFPGRVWSGRTRQLDPGRAGLGWAGLGRAGLGWAGLARSWLGWDRLVWAGLGWLGLGWGGTGWAVLAGMGQTGWGD